MNKLIRSQVTDKTIEELSKLSVDKKLEVIKIQAETARGLYKNVRQAKTRRTELARILTVLAAKQRSKS